MFLHLSRRFLEHSDFVAQGNFTIHKLYLLSDIVPHFLLLTITHSTLRQAWVEQEITPSS